MADPRAIGVISFPKSGNTWARAIITRALGETDAAAVVPTIYKGSIWQHPVQVGGQRTVFFKSHAATEPGRNAGRDFRSAHVLYLMRHPLDVFLSFLNWASGNVAAIPHLAIPCDSVEGVIARGELDLYFGAFCLYGTLQPQFADAGSWFRNTAFWLDRAAAEPDRVSLVRYKDMLDRGAEVLEPFARQVGLPLPALHRGFAAAAADTARDGRFFWRQEAGLYRRLLPPAMIARFAALHGASLARAGYPAD
jgi:hypothetical protein